MATPAPAQTPDVVDSAISQALNQNAPAPAASPNTPNVVDSAINQALGHNSPSSTQQANIPPELQAAYARGQHAPIPVEPPRTGLSGYIQDRKDQISDQATGVAKGAAETVHTVGTFLHDHLGVPMPEEILHPELEGGLEAKNTNEKVGKFGEAIGEFVLGDEAVKGLSIGKRLGLTQQVIKLASEHPIIAKAIVVGMNALRTGVVGGTEALVHGATPGEALKTGLETAGGGAALETVAGALPAAGKAVSRVMQGADSAQPGARAAVNTAVEEAGGAASTVTKPSSMTTALEQPIAQIEDKAKDAYKLVDNATEGKFQPNADKLRNVDMKLRDIVGTDPAKEAELEATKTRLMWQQDEMFNQAEKAGVPKETITQAKADFKQAQALRDVETKVFKNPNIVSGNDKFGMPEKINVDAAVKALQKLQYSEEWGAPRLEQAFGKNGAAGILRELYAAQKEGQTAMKYQDFAKLVAKITGIGVGLGTGVGAYELLKH